MAASNLAQRKWQLFHSYLQECIVFSIPDVKFPPTDGNGNSLTMIHNGFLFIIIQLNDISQVVCFNFFAKYFGSGVLR